MKFVERTVISLFALIGTSALTWLLVIGITNLFDMNGWTRLTASDWGTWVGAIGTVATLAMTIWIANTAQRDQKNAMQDAAVVAAAGLEMRIQDCLRKIRVVGSALALPIEDGYPPAYKALSKRLIDAANWSADELVALVHVPRHPAAHLAIAKERIGTISHMLELAGAAGYDLYEMADFNKQILEALKDATGKVESAQRECNLLLEKNEIF